jgi:cytochrome c553
MSKKFFYAILALFVSTSFSWAKEYSVAQVYTNMCSKCHGDHAQGNPEKKAPALNDMSKGELAYSLFDLVANGSQSSGSSHEVMEHNQKKIAAKGMTYHPDDMALYIYATFNKNAKLSQKDEFTSDGSKVYSVADIYKRMCSKCHGIDGTGIAEKKAPAINDMTKNELEATLYDLQSDGYQSSGSQHEVMSHNQSKIEEKGMRYHPEDMASYIYYNLNPDAKK